MATTKTNRRMPVAERRARVHAMSKAGKPQRVIAAELGISKDTVWRDIHTVVTPQVAKPAQTNATSAAPDPRSLDALDLAEHIVDALVILVDAETGDLPPHLSRMLCEAADKVRAQWRTAGRSTAPAQVANR